MNARLACLLLALLAGANVHADETSLAGCAARALPEHTMRQTQTVTISSAAGWQRESRRTVYWQRFDDGTIKVLFHVERPKTEAGLKLLVVQKPAADPVIHVFSPDMNRARRVVGSGASNSVLGTDFTFEDALYLQRFLGTAERVAVQDSTLDGHAVFVAETRPEADDSAYSRIRTFVDKHSCLPMKTEFYGHNGALDKTLTLARDAVIDIHGHAVATRMVMDNHLRKQRTELAASEIEIDAPLPPSLFTLAEIEKSH